MLAHDCLSTLIAPDPLGKSAGNAHKAEPAISIVALKLRRDADAGPFACQSCDNVQGNGDTLRQIVVGLAVMSGPDLAVWIDAQVILPEFHGRVHRACQRPKGIGAGPDFWHL